MVGASRRAVRHNARAQGQSPLTFFLLGCRALDCQEQSSRSVLCQPWNLRGRMPSHQSRVTLQRENSYTAGDSWGTR